MSARPVWVGQIVAEYEGGFILFRVIIYYLFIDIIIIIILGKGDAGPQKNKKKNSHSCTEFF